MENMRSPGILICMFAVLVILSVPNVQAAPGKIGAQILWVGSSLTGDLPNEGSWRSRGAPGFSLLTELDLTSEVSLCFQPGFVPRGTTRQFKARDEVVDEYDYKIDYLSLPLLVRVTGDPIGVRGFVTAGFELNVLLNATTDIGEGPEPSDHLFRSRTLGAFFGAGAMFPVGRNILSLELRYNQGLDDIVERGDAEEGPALGIASVKYRGISLLAGFLFRLGVD